MDDPRIGAFALDDQYTVVRHAAPETREGWEALFAILIGCGPEDAARAYDAMFPDGYDPDGTDDAVLHIADLDLGDRR